MCQGCSGSIDQHTKGFRISQAENRLSAIFFVRRLFTLDSLSDHGVLFLARHPQHRKQRAHFGP